MQSCSSRPSHHSRPITMKKKESGNANLEYTECPGGPLERVVANFGGNCRCSAEAARRLLHPHLAAAELLMARQSTPGSVIHKLEPSSVGTLQLVTWLLWTLTDVLDTRTVPAAARWPGAPPSRFGNLADEVQQLLLQIPLWFSHPPTAATTCTKAHAHSSPTHGQTSACVCVRARAVEAASRPLLSMNRGYGRLQVGVNHRGRCNGGGTGIHIYVHNLVCWLVQAARGAARNSQSQTLAQQPRLTVSGHQTARIVARHHTATSAWGLLAGPWLETWLAGGQGLASQEARAAAANVGRASAPINGPARGPARPRLLTWT